MQQGGKPSPFDRYMGTKFASKAFEWLIEQIKIANVFDPRSFSKVYTKDKTSACLVGLRSESYQFQPIEDLKKETDFTYRRWNHIWWKQIRPIVRILAQHDSKYISEGGNIGVSEETKGVL